MHNKTIHKAKRLKLRHALLCQLSIAGNSDNITKDGNNDGIIAAFPRNAPSSTDEWLT
jgi:hypothetical protein